MAQGTTSIKVKKVNVKASSRRTIAKTAKFKKKAAAITRRKGSARYVVPKKAPAKKAEQLRKNLENAIKANVEDALRARAVKEGIKPFNLAANGATSSQSQSTSSHSRRRGKRRQQQ